MLSSSSSSSTEKPRKLTVDAKLLASSVSCGGLLAEQVGKQHGSAAAAAGRVGDAVPCVSQAEIGCAAGSWACKFNRYIGHAHAC
jgi:hypothetical protein